MSMPAAAGGHGMHRGNGTQGHQLRRRLCDETIACGVWSEAGLYIASEDKKMAKRTTHRSTAGKKLYAKRDTAGKFDDIQTYERAHRQDLKKKSKAEKAKAKRG
jgi:hypothetical protein